MFLKPGVGVDLEPIHNSAPTGDVSALLYQWHNANFSKDKCAQILKDYIKKEKLPKNHGLNLNCVLDGKMIGSHSAMYFAQTKEWYFGIRSNSHKKTNETIGGYFSIKKARAISGLIKTFGISGDFESDRKNFGFLSTINFNKFFKNFSETSQRFSIWPETLSPGIYRREHASVMISSKTTQILVDPVFLSPRGTPPHVPWLRPQGSWGLPPDAVLITHSHADHWHIPSILASLNKPRSKVFVPYVPKSTILCSGFSNQMHSLGVPYQVAKWNTTFKVGDIEVDVLPFFGEQPSATLSPKDKNLRNWGNCYRINTPQFSAILLVDSGRDPLGNMADVVRASVKRRGPPDALLACMREFQAPFLPTGLGTYMLSLSFSQLTEMSKEFRAGKLMSSTAGLDKKMGIAAICRESKAKCFLPYAQGYAGLGIPIPAHDWGPNYGSEKYAMNFLSRQLQDLKIKTKAQLWNPGDRIYFENKEVLRTPFQELNGRKK